MLPNARYKIPPVTFTLNRIAYVNPCVIYWLHLNLWNEMQQLQPDGTENDGYIHKALPLGLAMTV